MSYPYDDAGGGNDNVQEALIPGGVDGACPPKIIEYRIYPEADFNDIFSAPPANVIT